MAKTFQIKNKYLPGLVYWLQELLLNANENRIRVNFVNLVQGQIDKIENKRTSLIEKYSKKDEKGESVVIISQTGKKVYDVDAEGAKIIGEEYNSLMESDFVLDLKNSEVEKKIKLIKNLIINTDYLFGIRENDTEEKKKERIQISIDYCVWLEAFEKLEF